MKTFIFMKAKTVYYTFLLSAFTFSAFGAKELVLNPRDNFSMPEPCPVITISGPTSICAGEVAVLSVSPADLPGFTYTWNPGGASGSSITTGALSATTVYTVTVSDGNMCTVSESFTVNVNANITPTFKSVSPVCGGAVISPLSTTSQNGITGTWSPALNNMATTTYTFTPNPGQCAVSTTLTIEVDPCCYQPEFCYGVEKNKISIESVSPSSHPSPCVYRYKWYWGDGTSSGTYNNANGASNAKHNYDVTGSYNVCLEIKRICPGSADTCCKMICKTINLIERCDANKINADIGLLLKSSIDGTNVKPVKAGSAFKALAGSELTIDYGTPLIAPYTEITVANNFDQAAAERIYTVPGTYEYCVTLKYVNAIGDSCVDKQCKSIIIEPFCETQAYFGVSSCASTFSFTFTPIGNGANTNVNWTFSNFATGTSVGNDPITHLAGNNIFQACMRVQDGKCYSSACYTVFANGSTTTVCGSAAAAAIYKDESGNVMKLDNIDLKSVLLPVEEGKENLSSFVYPNPTGNVVNLVMNAPNTSLAKITLRGSDGRVISSRTTTVHDSNSKEIVDVSVLENGMYVISIEVNGQVNTHKISVVK